jgi:hypothetical protein
MVQEKQERASGSQDPGDIGDRPIDVIDVFEHQASESRIERTIGEGNGCSAGLGKRHRPVPCRFRVALRRFGHHRGDRIDREDVGTISSKCTSDLPLTRSDVEHSTGTPELIGDDRNDLLGVLRIDPVGELALPPIGGVFGPPTDLQSFRTVGGRRAVSDNVVAWNVVAWNVVAGHERRPWVLA